LRARIGRETTLEEIFLDLVAQKEMDTEAPAESAAA
jgi:ABC-2 type transport system ATP-binding protein